MKRILVIIAAAVVLVGCASAMKSYQKGNYSEAVTLAVKKLRTDPDNEKATEALRLAYPLAQEVALREIETALKSDTNVGLERAVQLYAMLNAMADDIRRSPAALAIVKPVDYFDEQRQLQDVAAKQFYDAGVKALGKGTLAQARVAYDYFLKVQSYKPDYKDVTSKLAQARYEATMRVLVLPPITPRQYSISVEGLYERLLSDISRRKYSNFVAFYSKAQASKMKDEPHQVLVLDLNVFSIGDRIIKESTEEFSRDNVVVGQTTNKDGTKQDVIGTVKAKYKLTKMEITSSGTMTVRIIDNATQKVLRYRDLPGRSVWNAEWASYNGDSRALSDAQIRLTKNKPATPPPPQVIFDSFVEPLFDKATSYINSQY